MKIPELWTATKCSRIVALIKGRGVWKTSLQGLLNNIKQNIPRVLMHCLINTSSWRVLQFWGGTHVGVPHLYPKNIFSIFCLSPFKSPWQDLFKTPLTLVRVILLEYLMAFQSSGMFNIFRIFDVCPKFGNVQNFSF